MAKELQFQASAAGTYYALIRNATALVWNGTAFEAWVDANVGSYDVPLAREGTSLLYTATMPVLPAGRYSAVVHTQAGGSPAVSDVLAGGPWTFDWSGTAVLGAGDAPAALLDLAAGVETGLTVREALRLMAAVLFGKVSGATSLGGTIKFRDMADSKDRVTATTDATGNRSEVETDAT